MKQRDSREIKVATDSEVSLAIQLQIMAEQINNNESCDHVQLGGQAFFDERKYFLFSPDPSTSSGQVQAGLVQKFRGLGMAQQMPDGTFDFVRKPQLKAKSKLIKKLAHGRASETKDGAIQVTLKNHIWKAAANI